MTLTISVPLFVFLVTTSSELSFFFDGHSNAQIFSVLFEKSAQDEVAPIRFCLCADSLGGQRRRNNYLIN